MTLVNQKYRIKATVLSPLHVGQGEEKDWVEGIDFLCVDDELCHFNLESLEKQGVSLSDLSNKLVAGDLDGIRRLINPVLDDVCDFSLETPLKKVNRVKTFYFNPLTGSYTLFGSSLKGAIRSALFHYFSTGDQFSTFDKSGHKLDGRKLDESVFGSIKNGNDFMRFIRVGDFEFDNTSTSLVNTKIYNLYQRGDYWTGGWKHAFKHTDSSYSETGFNTVYECLKPGESADGVIMMSPCLFQKVQAGGFKNEKDSLMSGNCINKLFKIINEATNDYLIKEIAFFKEYDQGEHSDSIIRSLQRYQGIVSSCLNSDNASCVIKMSAGAGFHSITGDWQYDDYCDTGFHNSGRNAGKKKMKSRKIACNKGTYSPMGFLKLEWKSNE